MRQIQQFIIFGIDSSSRGRAADPTQAWHLFYFCIILTPQFCDVKFQKIRDIAPDEGSWVCHILAAIIARAHMHAHTEE
jgi:hypothetical protein